MKTILIQALILFLLCIPSFAQQTTADAQAQALKEFPQLADAGSEFNQRFLARFKKAKTNSEPVLQRADWPLLLAREVGAEMKSKPTQKITEERWGGGLKKIISLSVDQLAASPFTAEGAMVKLTGIRRIEPQEVEKGIYEVSIYGSDGGVLEGRVDGVAAAVIERSRELYVSISEPKKYRSKIIIHGNAAQYEGLATVPTATWKR